MLAGHGSAVFAGLAYELFVATLTSALQQMSCLLD
jgi:hypothetical protein